MDGALMKVDNLLHVGQSKSESLGIVQVAGVNPIELLEDFLQVLLLDTHSSIAYREIQVQVVVPRLHIYVERHVLLAIFHSVVQKIEYHVLKVHLIHIYR